MQKITLVTFVTITILNLFGCKNSQKNNDLETISKKTIQKIDSIKPEVANISDSKINDENCYDYLTELIRSSNFPFENIKKEKVNTLIDEDNGEIIRAKLFFDTEGTGTIGWVEYHFKVRKLLNTSANLEEPETLKFNIDYAKKFESCKGITGIKTSEILTNKSIESLYNLTQLIDLPNKYNYDFIVEEKDFTKVPSELYKSFDFENYFNFKIAKLPILGNIKPIFFIIYDESGQSKLHLITLDSNFKIVDKLKLYDSEDIDGGSLSTTYEISRNYEIKVKKALLVESGSKVIEKNVQIISYNINGIGKIQKN